MGAQAPRSLILSVSDGLRQPYEYGIATQVSVHFYLLAADTVSSNAIDLGSVFAALPLTLEIHPRSIWYGIVQTCVVPL